MVRVPSDVGESARRFFSGRREPDGVLRWFTQDVPRAYGFYPCEEGECLGERLVGSGAVLAVAIESIGLACDAARLEVEGREVAVLGSVLYQVLRGVLILEDDGHPASSCMTAVEREIERQLRDLRAEIADDDVDLWAGRKLSGTCSLRA